MAKRHRDLSYNKHKNIHHSHQPTLVFPDSNIIYKLAQLIIDNHYIEATHKKAYSNNPISRLYNSLLDGDITFIISPVVINELIRKTGFLKLVLTPEEFNEYKNYTDDTQRKVFAIKYVTKFIQNNISGKTKYLSINKTSDPYAYNLMDNIGDLAYKYILNGMGKTYTAEMNDLIHYSTASNLGIPFLTEDHIFADEEIKNLLKKVNEQQSGSRKYLINEVAYPLTSPIFNIASLLEKINQNGINISPRLDTLLKTKSINFTNGYDKESHNEIFESSATPIRTMINQKNDSLDEINDILDKNIELMKYASDTLSTTDSNMKFILNVILAFSKARTYNYNKAIKFINKIRFLENPGYIHFDKKPDGNGITFDLIRTNDGKLLGFNLNGIKYTLPFDQDPKINSRQKLTIGFDYKNLTLDSILTYAFFTQNPMFKISKFISNIRRAKNKNLQSLLESDNDILIKLSTLLENPHEIENMRMDDTTLSKNALEKLQSYLNHMKTYENPLLKEFDYSQHFDNISSM